MSSTVNVVKIEKALIRLEESLNKRYEKNAEMFISNQNIHKIKSLVCKGNFTNLTELIATNNIKPEIILITVLKNIWLVTEKGKFYKWCSEFLKEKISNPKQYDSYFVDIFNNQYDISQEMKNDFYRIYYHLILSLDEIKEKYKHYMSRKKKEKEILSLSDGIILKEIFNRILDNQANENDYVNQFVEIDENFKGMINRLPLPKQAHLNFDKIYHIFINKYLDKYRVEKPSNFSEYYVFNALFFNLSEQKNIIIDQLVDSLKDFPDDNNALYFKSNMILHSIRLIGNDLNKEDIFAKIINIFFKHIDDMHHHLITHIVHRGIQSLENDTKAKIIQQIIPHRNREDIVRQIRQHDSHSQRVNIKSVQDLYLFLEENENNAIGYVIGEIKHLSILYQTMLDCFNSTLLQDENKKDLWKNIIKKAITNLRVNDFNDIISRLLNNTTNQDIKQYVLQILRRNIVFTASLKKFLLDNDPNSYHRLYTSPST